MLGIVYEVDNQKKLAQISGAREGMIAMNEYECNIDYPVLLTNAPSFTHGCEYTLGTSNDQKIVYNPACYVCDDEDGNPVYKGVLKVPIVCSECTVGAENANLLKQGTESDNVYYNISYWGNAETAEGYHTLNKSTAYNLTINPATGDVCSKCFTATCDVTAMGYRFPNGAWIACNTHGGNALYGCDGAWALSVRQDSGTLTVGSDYKLDVKNITNCSEGTMTINAGSANAIALCGSSLTFNGNPVGNAGVNGNYNWASVTNTPRANEVRQYMYCSCAMNGYLSGSTLFIRTNTGWN